MDMDSILMIPYLSKELNLIGLPTLPYTLKKRNNSKPKSKSTEEPLEIVFNSRLMIEALTLVCSELVKQVKKIGADENTVLDKLNFENLNLEKQLKLNKSKTEKIKSELNSTKQVNQQLKEKVDELQKKLKHSEIENQNMVKRNQTNEDILKHALRKKESNLFELHKAMWKQFNMADKNYLPENFELVQLNQPDFSKLWSTVKYSDSKGKVEALKKAVCILQNNSKTLLEENFSLKISFLTILQEMHEMFKVMIDKMHMPEAISVSFKIKEIFEDIEGFNVSLYTSVLQKHFQVIQKICDLFSESSFIVSDDVFVCWSNIIKRL